MEDQPYSHIPGNLFQINIEPVYIALVLRTAMITHPIRRPPSLRILLLSHLYHSCVGVIGGKFAYVSWDLRAKDCMISIIAWADDTCSIAPTPDSRRGGLRRKWAGGGLCARPRNAFLLPSVWVGGSHYASICSGVSRMPSRLWVPRNSRFPPYSPAPLN